MHFSALPSQICFLIQLLVLCQHLLLSCIFFVCLASFSRRQVSDEKSCMQFSIQRPTLPSAEAHPEERLYRRLDVTTWLRHLNHSGQVEEEYKLRKVGQCVCMCYVFKVWKDM